MYLIKATAVTLRFPETPRIFSHGLLQKATRADGKDNVPKSRNNIQSIIFGRRFSKATPGSLLPCIQSFRAGAFHILPRALPGGPRTEAGIIPAGPGVRAGAQGRAAFPGCCSPAKLSCHLRLPRVLRS